MKRTNSLGPLWCALPVFLGLVAFVAGIFPSSPRGAEKGAEGGRKGAGKGSETSSLEQNQRHPLTRYESLWQRSLFHAPVQAVVANPAFAREYSLAGIFEMDGNTTAALVRKRDGVVVNVSDAEDVADGADGLKLISVETSGGTQGTKVQLEKGGMRAWIAATAVAASGARSNPVAASVAAPTATANGDTTEFSDWENFSGMRTGVSASEMPRQNDKAAGSAAAQTTPEFSIPAAPTPPKVRQPVPAPPSPLDAALAADEKEIVVPIDK